MIVCLFICVKDLDLETDLRITLITRICICFTIYTCFYNHYHRPQNLKTGGFPYNKTLDMEYFLIKSQFSQEQTKNQYQTLSVYTNKIL